jgi:serine O-acetyltransferase
MDAVRLYRLGRWLRARGVSGLTEGLRLLGRVLHDIDLPAEADIGPGLELGYGGLCVVVDPGARIGQDCFLSPGVTVGRLTPNGGAPVLGNSIYVGTGAKILGPVRVGDYAIIGANAVVTEDVPSGAIMAGIPAVELRRDPAPEENYRRFLASVRR